MARVAYIQNDEADPKVREMFDKIAKNGGAVVNLYRVLAHAPQICRAFIRFGNQLLFKGKLSPALREIAILLVSERTDANYERVKHRAMAQKAGVSAAQVAEVVNWEGSSHFDERERAVLRYTEEVTRDVRARPETYEALKTHFDSQAIVELTVTIGFYGMVSRILENMQVELEDDPTIV